jgi:hypothetical protein
MRFEIAFHAQRGRMRTDLSQQPTLDEKPQIVVDRGERNGWNATSDRGVNVFWRMVSVGSDDGLIDHLTLVRDRQTVLRGQLTELFMGEAHNYRMRISIKRPRAVSTEIFPVSSKRTGGRETRLWLSYHDWHRNLARQLLKSTLSAHNNLRVSRFWAVQRERPTVGMSVEPPGRLRRALQVASPESLAFAATIVQTITSSL